LVHLLQLAQEERSARRQSFMPTPLPSKGRSKKTATIRSGSESGRPTGRPGEIGCRKNCCGCLRIVRNLYG